MGAALKRLHLQETVLLEDDSQTMIKLVGKRVVPILVKDDGRPMLESMDMVAHVDSLCEPILVGPQRTELAAWASATADKTAPPFLVCPSSAPSLRMIISSSASKSGLAIWSSCAQGRAS
jgi:glutaredoxin 2